VQHQLSQNEPRQVSSQFLRATIFLPPLSVAGFVSVRVLHGLSLACNAFILFYLCCSGGSLVPSVLFCFFFLLFFSFHPLISLLNFFALFCGCSWSTSSRLSLGLVVYLPCVYRLVSISGWSDWAYFVIFMLSCSSAAAPVCQSSQKGARRSPGRGPAWLWSLDGTRSFVHSPFFPRN